MLGSLGCPYTCSFCIDSTVDYQPFSFQQLRDDLAFVLTKFKKPDHRLARPELRSPVRRLHGGDRGRGTPGQDAAHRREQSLAALRAPPQAAAPERLPGHSAGYRVVVRSREQIEDPEHRDGEGPAGRGSCEHDSALHPLHPDQFRRWHGRRRRAGTVRAHQAIPRPRSGRLPRLLAAVRLWPGGAR